MSLNVWGGECGLGYTRRKEEREKLDWDRDKDAKQLNSHFASAGTGIVAIHALFDCTAYPIDIGSGGFF